MNFGIGFKGDNAQKLDLLGGREKNRIVVAGRILKAQYKPTEFYKDTVIISAEY